NHPVHINRIITAVGMDGDPMPRGPVRLVIPRSCRVPIIPNVIPARFSCAHASFHHLPPLAGVILEDWLFRYVVHRDKPAGDVILLVGGIGKSIGVPAFITVSPFVGLTVDSKFGNNPYAASIDLAPTAPRNPFIEY